VLSFDFSLLDLVLLVLCVGFIARSARREHRSPLLWGALSLALWLLLANDLGGGLSGGLLSQLLVLAGVTGWEMYLARRSG